MFIHSFKSRLALAMTLPLRWSLKREGDQGKTRMTRLCTWRKLKEVPGFCGIDKFCIWYGKRRVKSLFMKVSPLYTDALKRNRWAHCLTKVIYEIVLNASPCIKKALWYLNSEFWNFYCTHVYTTCPVCPDSLIHNQLWAIDKNHDQV